VGDPSRGRTLVVTAGIHGNEPAGVFAVQRVLARCRALGLAMRGQLVALAGNRAALRAGVRFVERDLNRRWHADALARLQQRAVAGEGPELSAEDREQAELHATFRALAAQATAPLACLDLHSFSGPGAPFACMADTLANRAMSRHLPLPVILGLEEIIDGSMLGDLTDRGHAGVAVEGGRHDDPATVDGLETTVWTVMTTLGLLHTSELPGYWERRRQLAARAAGLPRIVEVLHRHVVAPDDGFAMRPGFSSFQPIARGQPLADDRGGVIAAPRAGLMLLPRYQGQGEDGFFIARAVDRRWLRAADVARRVGLDRLAARLPGVRRAPELPDGLLVVPHRAASVRVELLRMLGYRRAESRDGLLVLQRRRQRAR
jgi:succinylglutamate desuccinylase